MTTPGSDGDTSEEGVVGRARRMAEVASAQARVIARRAERRRTRGRWAVGIGCAAGGIGLAVSVGAAFTGASVEHLWWLLVPAWILAALPILMLAQREGDALRVLGARAAGTSEVADGIRRTVEASPSRFETGPDGFEALGPLTALVERDIEGARRSLHARTGSTRRRHRRIVPRERRIIVTTVDGRRLRATIADLSPSGVAMTEALPRLERGQSAIVGRTWARVARTWDKGIAFEFEVDLDPSTFDEEIVL